MIEAVAVKRAESIPESEMTWTFARSSWVELRGLEPLTPTLPAWSGVDRNVYNDLQLRLSCPSMGVPGRDRMPALPSTAAVSRAGTRPTHDGSFPALSMGALLTR
jgi:hypothetical protein